MAMTGELFLGEVAAEVEIGDGGEMQEKEVVPAALKLPFGIQVLYLVLLWPALKAEGAEWQPRDNISVYCFVLAGYTGNRCFSHLPISAGRYGFGRCAAVTIRR